MNGNPSRVNIKQLCGSVDGVTTSFQLSQNSRPPCSIIKDKYMMKAQVHVSKSFAISDVQALPQRKHYCQNDKSIKCTFLVAFVCLIIHGNCFVGRGRIEAVDSNGHLRSCPSDLGGIVRGRGNRSFGRLAGSRRIRVGSWNETKWKGSRAREGNGYKMCIARNGVGIILAGRHKDNVVRVTRRGDRIMAISVVIEGETVNVISAYAPHVGLSDADKKRFWDALDEMVKECPTNQRLIIGGDLNDHIGAAADGYAEVHGGFGFGERNEEGCTILEFATAHDLVVANSFFKKRDAHLITFQSGGHNTQIDYLLVHVLLERLRHRREATERPRILWKNLNGEAVETFRATIFERLMVEDMSASSTDQMWNTLACVMKDAVGLSDADKKRFWDALDEMVRECSTNQRLIIRGDLNDHIGAAVDGYAEVHGLEKGMKKGARGDLKACKDCRAFLGGACSSQHRLNIMDVLLERLRHMREATERPRILWKNLNGEAVETFRATVFEKLVVEDMSASSADQMWNTLACEVQTKVAMKQSRFKDLLSCSEGNQKDIDRAKERDIGNVKYIKDEGGRTIVREEDIRTRWGEYFSSLFNETPSEESRPEESEEVRRSSSPAHFDCYYSRINHGEVRAALQKMGRNKAVGPDQIPIEAWRGLEDKGVKWLTCLFNKIFSSAKMSDEWRLSEVIPVYKNKGDAQACSNYRGIKLLSHTMKLWERVIKKRLRRESRVLENQFGFMPGRSKTEAIHLLRSLMEKYRERQRDLHMDFLDLEKAYDSVPRELVWKTLLDKGTPRRYSRVTKFMYEGAKTHVRTTTENTKYFPINLGLHQGSAISPYLFTLILDELSRGIQENIPWCMIFADDIVLIAESAERYEVVHQEMDIRIKDQILQPKESFRYLGSVLHRSRRIVDDAAIRPTMLYGCECWPITKALAFRVEVAELRMLRWTCDKTMVDMISNEAFIAALDVDSISNKMREGRLRWFGHIKRRPQSASVRRVEAMVVEGLRRRGRPKLRWEDRLKMDMKELRLSEDMTSDRNA
nr:hypothetical protein [Tanacetum cinerariifolium]